MILRKKPREPMCFQPDAHPTLREGEKLRLVLYFGFERTCRTKSLVLTVKAVLYATETCLLEVGFVSQVVVKLVQVWVVAWRFMYSIAFNYYPHVPQQNSTVIWQN